MDTRTHWIATTDARGAALYACQATPGGSFHIEKRRSIGNAHEKEHEQHRPTRLGGGERHGSVASSGAKAAPQSTAYGHEVEEEERRFAHEVKGWLAEAERELNMDRVIVFAAPRFLGVLRHQMSTHPSKAELREGEFTHLNVTELAAHPTIKGALEWPRAARNLIGWRRVNVVSVARVNDAP